MVRPLHILAIVGLATASPTRFEAADRRQEAAAAKRQDGEGVEWPEIEWPDIPALDDITIIPGEPGDPPPNHERIPIIGDDEMESIEEITRQIEWKASFCDHRSIGSAEDGAAIIDHTRAIWEIDEYIANHGAHNWLANFERDKFKSQLDAVSNIGDCMYRGGTCRPGPAGWTCLRYFEFTDVHQTRCAYWIFVTVSRIHQKLTLLGSKLTEDVVDAHLSMADFSKDWDGEQDGGEDFMQWFNMALSVGGLLVGGIPTAGSSIAAIGTISSTVFTLATHDWNGSGKGSGKITTQEITSLLKQYYDTARTKLDFMLSIGFGNKVLSADSDATLVLPVVRDSDNLKTDIGRWLNNGFWLVDTDQTAAIDTFLDMTKDISRKFVDMKLREHDYHLTADMNHDEASCNSNGQGWHWLEYNGAWYCFHMMRLEGEHDHFNQQAHTERQEFYDKMNKYGFATPGKDYYREYYQSLLSCYKARGHDNQVTFEGDFNFGDRPDCFYNVKVIKYQMAPVKVCNSYGNICRHFEIVPL